MQIAAFRKSPARIVPEKVKHAASRQTQAPSVTVDVEELTLKLENAREVAVDPAAVGIVTPFKERTTVCVRRSRRISSRISERYPNAVVNA